MDGWIDGCIDRLPSPLRSIFSNTMSVNSSSEISCSAPLMARMACGRKTIADESVSCERVLL